jgi:hypothetical protein
MWHVAQAPPVRWKAARALEENVANGATRAALNKRA